MVLGFALAGCVHTGFTRTTAMVVRARAPGCYLDLVSPGPPRKPYVELGQIATDSRSPRVLYGLGENNVSDLRRMMNQACAIGAHGLMYLSVNSHHTGLAKGWDSTTGTAVAFVYVDRSGRPLPPPAPGRGAPVWAAPP
jgi:hypothetical protein